MSQTTHVVRFDNKVFSCILLHHNQLHIHAETTFMPNDSNGANVTQNAVLKIMEIRGVRKISPKQYDDMDILLSRYRRAVRLIERAVLNPNTPIGRKRLEREFELIISDSGDT